MIGLVTRLLSAIPRGRARFVAAIALGVAATGASVALLGVSAWLLTLAAEHPAVAALTVPATAVRMFGTSRGAFRYAERLCGHDLALNMQGALRLSVYDKLARTTLLGARRGDLLTRVTADVEAIMDVVVRVALPFASASVVVLGTSLILATFDVASAVVLLGCAVIAGIVVPWVAARLSLRDDAATVPLRAAMADVVYETALAAPELVAYGASETQFAKLAEADAQLRRADQRAAWTRGLAVGAQSVVMGMAVAAALLFGADAVVTGELRAPALAVLVFTPLALAESFDDLAKAAQVMTRARASLERVTALLDAAPVGVGDRARTVTETSDRGVPDSATEGAAPVAHDPASITALSSVRIAAAAETSQHPARIRPPSDSSAECSPSAAHAPLLQHVASPQAVPQEDSSYATSPQTTAAVLALRDLVIGWPDAPPLLHGINLELGPGERVAVTGASGVGKTTLAATILGMIPPAAGELIADDSIGYLAQDAHIFATTVAENVRIGNPWATDDAITAALARVGLSYLDLAREVSAQTLSGGEARRVAAARLLVLRPAPALVILDEPTEHLDHESAAALMRDLWAAFGPTTALLVITHDAEVIARCPGELRL
ncbi:MAG: ATP-binding cassette domain-containing protein [Propionibacteriaceae bacterium]|jgi:ATP-binding cassette subfamily C protein CydCD|nr:ATP-binding cassette domain-containing protein [Propionibacteriaceae bacterium]